LADVAVVQAADFGKLDDLSCDGKLDRPEVGRVLVQREVSTRPVVVGEVLGQDAAEVSLAEDEHVIQALAPDRAEIIRCDYTLHWHRKQAGIVRRSAQGSQGKESACLIVLVRNSIGEGLR
jgi:hypothetical protein